MKGIERASTRKIRKADLSPTGAAAKTRLVYYALGGGLGHLTRAIAILNSLENLSPNRFYKILLSNSPYMRSVCIAADERIEIPSSSMLKQALSNALRPEPHLFIVDSFPRGLMGDLVEPLNNLHSCRILIQRYLNQTYVDQFSIADFATDHYDLSLRLADDLPKQHLHKHTIDIPPVTILSEISLKAPPMIYDDSNGRKRMLFVDFGEEADEYINAIPPDFDARIVTLNPNRLRRYEKALSHYPAVELFRQADLIVGACGYNLYHEVKATGAEAIFLPQKKTYDDQFGRARSSVYADSTEVYADLLAKWEKPASKNLANGLANGARVAAEAILNYFIETRTR